MGRPSFWRSLDLSVNSFGSRAWFGKKAQKNHDDIKEPLATSNDGSQMRGLKDALAGHQILKPKRVVLRVPMDCQGCARKIEKHISKMAGVSSYQVDLENNMVVVMGDVAPWEVVESVSKVKTAELWISQAVEI